MPGIDDLKKELETALEDKRQLLLVVSHLSSDLRLTYSNLTETQKRCTDLLKQVREYRQRGLVLSGWTCSNCRCFNGEAKQDRLECRACGKPAPEGTSVEPPRD